MDLEGHASATLNYFVSEYLESINDTSGHEPSAPEIIQITK